MVALDDGLPGALVAEGEALENASVPAQLNHHIVHARDPEASARFLAEILHLPAPTRFGPFVVVQAANGVSLDFIGTDDEKYLVPNHCYPRPEARSGLRWTKEREVPGDRAAPSRNELRASRYPRPPSPDRA